MSVLRLNGVYGCVAWALTAGLAGAQPASRSDSSAPPTHPQLRPVEERLAEWIPKELPGARLEVKGSTLRLTYHTRPFMIHPLIPPTKREPERRYAAKAEEVEGPDFDGVLLEVYVSDRGFIPSRFSSLRRQPARTEDELYWESYRNSYVLQASPNEAVRITLKSGFSTRETTTAALLGVVRRLLPQDPQDYEEQYPFLRSLRKPEGKAKGM